MRICGFNKTTLLDYPGKVASTIFLGGCNFRCPFCQNGILVVAPGEQPDYSQEELLTFLKKRKGILDGVCISGGEPTLSDGLEEFLGKIKELGYAVKLDTNGSRPKIEACMQDIELTHIFVLFEQNAEELFGLEFRVEFDIEHGCGIKIRINDGKYDIVEVGTGDVAFC